jgi:hypothetical protein
MARRGPKRNLERESEYWRLLLSGMGTVDARPSGVAGILGTGGRRRTVVCRRRGGRDGALRPVPVAAGAATDRDAARAGADHPGDRQRLGQAPSTVSRELRRNVAPHGRGGYDGDLGWATPAELFHTALAQSTSSCCDDRSNPPWNPPVDTGSVFSRRRQPMTVRTCWQAHYFGDFLVRPAIFAVRPTVPARWLAL